MDINDYINGTPIEPGVTYKLGNADANSAWTLVSDRPCLFKLSATAPTDSAWSNVTEEQYIINGDVSNQVIEITSPNGKYFVVATHDQDSAATVESAYATVSLKPLGFNVEDSYETTPWSGDGPVTEGFYKISNLESGKLYSFNVTPDAGGLKATNPSPEYAFSLFSVDGSNNPKALLAAGVTECQLVFVATESTAVLNLSSTLPDSEFFVCIRNFSLGSDGSGFDPSSDQSITGAWTFSNITVPTPTASGQAANKGYVDSNFVSKSGNETITGIKTFSSSPVVPSPTENEQAAPKSYVDSAVDSVHEFNPAEAQNITGSWSFSDGLTRATKASPTNTDIMNKEMSDAVYVPKAGDSTVEGTKTFSGSITLANEAPLVLGTGTEAVKISGSGTGSAVIEGDKVQFINQGRTLPKPYEYGRTYIVSHSETESGIVYIDGCGLSYSLLEVVEPVEKIYPLVFHEAVKYMTEGYILERLSPVSEAKFQIRMIEGHIQSRDSESTDDIDWCPCVLDDEDVMSRWKIVD